MNNVEGGAISGGGPTGGPAGGGGVAVGVGSAVSVGSAVGISAPGMEVGPGPGFSGPDSVWKSTNFHIVNEGPVSIGELNSLPSAGKIGFRPVQTEVVPVSSVVDQAQEVAAAAWQISEVKPNLGVVSEPLFIREVNKMNKPNILDTRPNIGLFLPSEADIRQAQVVVEAFNNAGVEPQISQKLVSKALAHTQSVVNTQTETRTQTQNPEVLTEEKDRASEEFKKLMEEMSLLKKVKMVDQFVLRQ